jgi:hypothetical protein
MWFSNQTHYNIILSEINTYIHTLVVATTISTKPILGHLATASEVAGRQSLPF